MTVRAISIKQTRLQNL